jgi:hypothetical protein
MHSSRRIALARCTPGIPNTHVSSFSFFASFRYQIIIIMTQTLPLEFLPSDIKGFRLCAMTSLMVSSGWPVPNHKQQQLAMPSHAAASSQLVLGRTHVGFFVISC